MENGRWKSRGSYIIFVSKSQKLENYFIDLSFCPNQITLILYGDLVAHVEWAKIVLP